MSTDRKREYSGKWHRVRRNFWAQYRSGAVCHLCGHPVDTQLTGKGPWSRSIDHIHPVSQGGLEYDLSSCRPAHRVCNNARGDKPISEFATEEQRAAFRELVEALATAQEARQRLKQVHAETPAQPAPVKPKQKDIHWTGIDVTGWTGEQKRKLRHFVPAGWDYNSPVLDDGSPRPGWTPFQPGWDLESVLALNPHTSA